MPAVRPLYLETPGGACFGVLHESYDEPAVLICPPWGWEEVASYRSRKRWAEALARAGHPALRLDLPGTGQSEGNPWEPGVVGRWLDAIEAAATWLAKETGVAVVALGLGVGGVLASEAIARGAPIKCLLLWGAPTTGRAAVRKIRAFAMIQEWDQGDAEKTSKVEAGGFALNVTALEELGAIASPSVSALPEEWVLVLPDRGWASLIGHPQESRLSEDTVLAAERWLSVQRPDRPSSKGATPAREREEISLHLDGREVRERSWSTELGFGRAHGILAEPKVGGANEVCGLFLNAGAVRSIGPNRIWVEVARAWAAGGIPSLRLDLEAIGDTDGDEREFESVAEFYVPRYVDQVEEVINALTTTGLGARFNVVGLCAGSYWAYQAALRDRRISHLVLFNPGGLAWSPDEGRGELPADLPPWSKRVPNWSELDSLRDQRTRLTLAFSSEEPLRDALEEAGFYAHLGRWPNVRVDELPGSDHTLRPLSAQFAAKALLLHSFGAPEIWTTARSCNKEREPPRYTDRRG